MIKIATAFLALCLLGSCRNAEELKSEQYFVEGLQLYTANCSNCHQADGNGLSNLYPPLAGSERLTDRASMACIIKNGMKGTIIVNGMEFNRPMPANAKLTEIEIAEIVSYVSMKWGKDSLFTPITYVENALKNCKPD